MDGVDIGNCLNWQAARNGRYLADYNISAPFPPPVSVHIYLWILDFVVDSNATQWEGTVLSQAVESGGKDLGVEGQKERKG